MSFSGSNEPFSGSGGSGGDSDFDTETGFESDDEIETDYDDYDTGSSGDTTTDDDDDDGYTPGSRTEGSFDDDGTDFDTSTGFESSDPDPSTDPSTIEGVGDEPAETPDAGDSPVGDGSRDGGDSATTSAGAGGGIGGQVGGDAPGTGGLSDPTAESSPGGVNVTGTEASDLLSEARQQETTIGNLDERQALAAQIERQTGVDAREIAQEYGDGADVSLDPAAGVFRVRRRRRRRDEGAGFQVTGEAAQELTSDSEAGDRVEGGFDELVSDTEAGDLRFAASPSLVSDTEAGDRLDTQPRRDRPRTSIPAGAIRFGETQTGIYRRGRDQTVDRDRTLGTAAQRFGTAVTSGDVAGVGDVLAGSFDEFVGRAPTDATRAARRYDKPLDVLAGSTDEAVGRAAVEAREGDLGARGDTAGVVNALTPDLPPSVRRTFETDEARGGETAAARIDAEQLARGSSAAVENVGPAVERFVREQAAPQAGGVDTTGAATSIVGGGATEAIASAEVDRDVTDEVTVGGELTEAQERTLRRGSQQLSADISTGVEATSGFAAPVTIERTADTVVGAEEDIATDVLLGEDAPESTIGETERAGEGPGERIVESGAETILSTVDPFGLAVGAETGLEVAENAPDLSREEQAALGSSAVALGTAAATRAATSARRRPASAIGSIGGGYLLGAGASAAIGRGARRLTDISRTAGGRDVDVTGLTNPRTVAHAEGEITDADAKFPGAEDPGQYRTDPAEAVGQQAEEYTPEEVAAQFPEGAEGAVIKKALDVDPDAPDRAPSGFETQEGSYESPGSFFGPEFSVNFLRVGGGRVGLRPGLPGLGSRPTGVIARTDVENPDADTLEGFNEELLERAGETTARTKPAGEVNPGEIEAVVPPEAEFVPTGDDLLYTRIAGRRVPLRTVLPADRDADVDADAGIDAGEADALARFARREDDTEARTLEEYSRGFGDDTDNPLPNLPDSEVGVSSRRSTFDSDRSPFPPSSSSVGRRSSGRRSSDRSFLSSVLGGSSGSGGSGESSGGSPSLSFMPSGGSGGRDGGGGSSGGRGGSGTSGGGSSGGYPPPSSPPTRPDTDDPEGDDGPDEDALAFLGAVDTEFTAFVDPLTGERLATETDTPEPRMGFFALPSPGA